MNTLRLATAVAIFVPLFTACTAPIGPAPIEERTTSGSAALTTTRRPVTLVPSKRLAPSLQPTAEDCYSTLRRDTHDCYEYNQSILDECNTQAEEDFEACAANAR